VRQGDRLAATFHPELGDDVRVHALLVSAAAAAARRR
jgi:glutamine amidotransferase PdxT